MKAIRSLALALAVPSLAFSQSVLAKTVEITSPDNLIKFSISDDTDRLQYKVSYQNAPLINDSQLGLVFKEHPNLGLNAEIVDSKTKTRDTTWEQPWGEQRLIRDHHNELVVDVKKDEYMYRLRIRAFNDGLGFRYEVPEQAAMGDVVVTDEKTEFVVADSQDSTAWWIPSRGWNRYEYIYNTTKLHDIDRVHTPFTFKNKSGVHVSIHEAALTDFAAMTLDQRRDGTLKSDLTPWSDGDLVKTKVPFNTPWRTIQIAPDAVGLLNSHMILNLNEPNKLGDVSWVEPGKYVGIWWGMHVKEVTWGSGDKHGATTSETKRYMDFAAKYGFKGVLVEGWNIGWDGEWFNNGDVFKFDKPYADFDIQAIADYGREKGVRLIGHHETSGNVTNYRNQMQAAFDLYEKHDVAQIKTGYVADGGNIKRVDEDGRVYKEWHDGQFMVNEYLYNITEAAKRKISINTHEPIKATGLRRTYPNWIAREGARGQEFNAWGNPANPPEHTAILPYTRMLGGPMDFTPGIFDMGFNGLDSENRPKTTLAKQLALYVVLYSPIQMAADLPRNYEAKRDAFQFILDVPVDWEESRAVAGEIGDYVVFARKDKHSQDWFLGGLTDEDARELDLKLDFLDPGKKYQAQVYVDGKDAEWRTNPYDISIYNQDVTSKSTLKLNLATSGGVAIRFKAL